MLSQSPTDTEDDGGSRRTEGFVLYRGSHMAVTPLKTKEKGTLSTYPVHKYASSNKLEGDVRRQKTPSTLAAVLDSCLLYTSDAADE